MILKIPPDSYYDWELKFKKNERINSLGFTESKFKELLKEKDMPKTVKPEVGESGGINSLGITESEFNEFMKKWKEKNLKTEK